MLFSKKLKYPTQIEIDYYGQIYKITKIPISSPDGFIYFHHINNSFSSYLQFADKNIVISENDNKFILRKINDKQGDVILCVGLLEKLHELETKGMNSFSGGINEKWEYLDKKFRTMSNTRGVISFEGEDKNIKIKFSVIDNINIVQL